MTNSDRPPYTPTPSSLQGGRSSVQQELAEFRSQGSVNQSRLSQGSHSRTSVENTPNRNARYGDNLDPEGWERKEHRLKLVEELHRDGQGEEMPFPGLMDTLGLGDKYLVYKSGTTEPLDQPAYESGTTESFKQLAKSISSVCSVVSTRGRQKSKANLAEKDYIEGFKRVLDKLSNFSPRGLPPGHSPAQYTHKDCQNKALKPSGLKPDLVFAPVDTTVHTMKDVHLILEAKGPMERHTAYEKNLGQLADYALEFKTLQPMRKFVPVLFLYGCQLDLVVFTHGGYYWADIGIALYEDDGDKDSFSRMARNMLRDLWFILTLPVCEFGQIIDSLSEPDFAQLDMTTKPASFVPLPISRGSNLKDIKRIDRKVHITGRCTYLFRACYKGDDVVFKLTWLRTNRLPEGAVYRVLEDSNVPHIPMIHASGVLVQDFCGHRLEYLVVEYCGVSVVDHIRSLRRNGALASDVAEKVKACTQSVMQTLVAALRANVLHRDVSPGNVTIKGNRVYVIDWGCAKLTALPSIKQAEDMTSRWGFDSSGVVGKESEKDPFTGTPLYMSVPTLFKISQRGVFNDIESLFYVVLDSLSDRIRDRRSEDALGFAFYNESNLAMVRIGILGDDQRYLNNFGVKSIGSSALKDILDAMRKFLFFEGDHYIGGRLQAFYERKVDSSVAVHFMRQETLNLLIETLLYQQAAPTMSSSQIDSTAPDLSTMAIASQSGPPHWPLNPTAIAAASNDISVLVNPLLGSLADDSFELVIPVIGPATSSISLGLLEYHGNEQATSSASLPGPVVDMAGQSNPTASTGGAGPSNSSGVSEDRKRARDEKMDDDDSTKKSKELRKKQSH
ncbi:hypothetical protein GGH94_001808 [Coemansia aciculifera]|uniref:Protein kinase domain-containing protein n=1 Tax=Coemansia aciculifera TaxID=417176 RepID=A0A9W8M7A8_9FUNG|nr:hypothetical protein GGH94_001808 [Coemansia aciculifera]